MACACSARTAETIDKAEDRQLFKDTMESIGSLHPSKVVDHAWRMRWIRGRAIGYPVIIRPAFTLGGTGGGIAYDERSCGDRGPNGLTLSSRSPRSSSSVHRRLEGDRVRGHARRQGQRHHRLLHGKLRPVGVHTGDSIVVAPAQTLSDKEYQMLRTAALNIIRARHRGRLQLPVRAQPRLL